MAAIAGRIASSEHRPTAICVETDEAAVAIMRHLRQLGIRIPEDLSIIGFGDHPTAVVAGLTTLHQDRSTWRDWPRNNCSPHARRSS